jgi:hypothetical protein
MEGGDGVKKVKITVSSTPGKVRAPKRFVQLKRKEEQEELFKYVRTHADADHIQEENWNRMVLNVRDLTREEWESAWENGDVDLAFDASTGEEPAPEPAPPPSPPRGLELLLTIGAITDKLEAELGDINELFEREVETLGVQHANLRYWGKGIRLLFKILKPLLARAVKWGVIADLIRRYIP